MPGVDVLASVFNGANAAFIADLYARWVNDPASVDPSFAELVRRHERRGARRAAGRERRVLGAAALRRSASAEPAAKPRAARPPPAVPAPEQVRAARARQPARADADPRLPGARPSRGPARPARPAGAQAAPRARPRHLRLRPERPRPADLHRRRARPRDGDRQRDHRASSAPAIAARSASSSCTSRIPDQKTWIQRRIEGAPWTSRLRRRRQAHASCTQLTEAEGFEAFCQKRYVGTKRFGLEGGEVTIPALHADHRHRRPAAGVNEIAIGMPHRGRLNTLVNVVKKPFTAVFSEFGGASSQPDDVQGSGDVKYHLGTSTDVEIAGQQGAYLAAAEPVASRGGRPGGDRQGPRPAGRGRRHHGPAQRHGHPDARRRRLRRPGPGLRDAGDEPAHRLPHRRHGPSDRQQPDRLHHRPGARLFRPLLHRRRQIDAVPDPARQRRRAGGGGVLRPLRRRVPHAVRHRHRARHRLLPPPRPQRDRRAGLHPADHVSRDQGAADHARAVCRAAGRPKARCREAEAQAIWDDVPGHARGRLQGGAVLSAEQGRLARGPLVRAEAGRRRRASGSTTPTAMQPRRAAGGRPRALHARRPISTSTRRSPASSRPSAR